MSAFQLTPEQSAAVTDRGGALLVSAAAGSGKTRVLVERLMSELDAGHHVDEFLIITYTNAAAAELRGKILDALYERIAREPENTRLHREASLCGRAHIETIHSFCLGLIRENVTALGLSPDVRVADETESGFLKRDVLEALVEERYDSGDESFRELADTVGAGRNDEALLDVVLDTHTKLLSHPVPEDWVRARLAELDLEGVSDLAETPWGKILTESAAGSAAYWEDRLAALLQESGESEDFTRAYGESLQATLEGLGELREALNRSWDAACAAQVPFPRAKPIKGYDDWKEVRSQCKKAVEKLLEPFAVASEKALADLRQVAPTMRAVLELVLEFEERYSREKRRRNLLDFADQEHLALRLLSDETFSRETAARFREIMVDEYQDVNAIQEAIFSAVSRDGRNVFMVGDVKQSIYRFRLADPTIFLRKYAAFRDAAEASEGEERKLVLSRNFRSRREILSAVNFIFQNVMSPAFGDVAYTEREMLYPGAEYPESASPPVELDVLDASQVSGEDDDMEKAEVEARFAAQRILELMASETVSDGAGGLRPLRFDDIAVLMRSPKARQGKWAEIFALYGVPLAAESPSDFFGQWEVSLTMSFLAVIDNPRQDVALAAVLRSPVYGFTADELAAVRAGTPAGDFYTALTAAAETNEKCAAFLEELRSYRLLAPDLTVAQFLWHLYQRTRLPALAAAMPGAEQRQRNLMRVFEYARTFEQAGYKGLFGFVAFLRRVSEEEKKPELSPEGAENAVRLMSIHKSKGLEFPVVILADTTKRFNTDDQKKPLLIHPELGVGPRRVDLARRIEYPTVARLAVRERLAAEGLSEELRVLYVALTRAREKLILLASYKDPEKELQKLVNVPLPAPPALLREAKSMAEWILIPALRRPESGPIRFGAEAAPCDCEGRWDVRYVTELAPGTRLVSEPAGERQEAVDPEALRALTEQLAFRYPYEKSAAIASKLTATELKGTYRTAEAAEEAAPMQDMFTLVPRRPAFMEGKRGLTPAQKGTATHIVMQFADFAKCLTEAGVRGEIERLRANRTITDEQAHAVRPGVIADFFQSDVGRRVLSAEKVWRELKFSLLVDSEELTGVSGEKLLLQGVVDCCVLRNGHLTVIDFKTDFVTGETAAERAKFYAGQLSAYAMAMERVLGLPVEERLVCFLTAGIAVAV